MKRNPSPGALPSSPAPVPPPAEPGAGARPGTSAEDRPAVALELEPGQMSMHDVYLIHGAEANRSAKRRTGIALRYMPGTSVFERDITLNCVSNEVGGPYIGGARWLGVRVSDLLAVLRG